MDTLQHEGKIARVGKAEGEIAKVGKAKGEIANGHKKNKRKIA